MPMREMGSPRRVHFYARGGRVVLMVVCKTPSRCWRAFRGFEVWKSKFQSYKIFFFSLSVQPIFCQAFHSMKVKHDLAEWRWSGVFMTVKYKKNCKNEKKSKIQQLMLSGHWVDTGVTSLVYMVTSQRGWINQDAKSTKVHFIYSHLFLSLFLIRNDADCDFTQTNVYWTLCIMPINQF